MGHQQIRQTAYGKAADGGLLKARKLVYSNRRELTGSGGTKLRAAGKRQTDQRICIAAAIYERNRPDPWPEHKKPAGPLWRLPSYGAGGGTRTRTPYGNGT